MSGLKLSEAIRLGSMLHAQGFGALISHDGKRTCALGAARQAGFDIHVVMHVMHEGPYGPRLTIPCPQCNGSTPFGSLGGMIFHLNDVHRWTRERIADFVEIVENKKKGEKVEQIEPSLVAG